MATHFQEGEGGSLPAFSWVGPEPTQHRLPIFSRRPWLDSVGEELDVIDTPTLFGHNFIERSFTYHTHNPFQVYDPVVFSIVGVV